MIRSGLSTFVFWEPSWIKIIFTPARSCITKVTSVLSPPRTSWGVGGGAGAGRGSCLVQKDEGLWLGGVGWGRS